MADDGPDDNEPEPEGQGMWFGSSQQMYEMMAAQADTQQMATEVFLHSVSRMVDEADKDTLMAMSRLLRISGGGSAMSAYYSGIMEGVLHVKYGTCFACDKNHDEELKKEIPVEGNLLTCGEGHEEVNMQPSDVHVGMMQCPACGRIE